MNDGGGNGILQQQYARQDPARALPLEDRRHHGDAAQQEQPRQPLERQAVGEHAISSQAGGRSGWLHLHKAICGGEKAPGYQLEERVYHLH